jgi:hypothetical protein
MKNKPHPRWVQTTLAKVAQDAEKWHERMNDANAAAAAAAACSSDIAPLPPQSSTPSPTRTASSSPRSVAGSLSDRCEAPHVLPHLTGSPTFHSIHPQQHLAPDASPAPALEHSHHSSVSSPSSSPSPVIMSPIEPSSSMPVSVVGSSDFDLASILSSYSPQTSNDYEDSHNLAYSEMMQTNKVSAARSPVAAAHDENSYFHNVFPAPRHEHGHCGCLHDAASYNVLLELSLRLRKAAQVLANSSNHRLGLTCPVNQRVTELDNFASNALTNISCTIDTLSPTSLLQSHHAPTAALMSAHHSAPQYASPNGPALPNNMRPIAPTNVPGTGATTPVTSSAITTPGLHNGWDLSTPMANYQAAQASNGADDPFMSWERLRAQ